MPFKIKHVVDGKEVLSAKKVKDNVKPTKVGATDDISFQAVLFQGEEVIIETERTNEYNAFTYSFRIPDTATSEKPHPIEILLTKVSGLSRGFDYYSGGGYPPQGPTMGSGGDGLVTIEAAPGSMLNALASMPLPPGLGFVVSKPAPLLPDGTTDESAPSTYIASDFFRLNEPIDGKPGTATGRFEVGAMDKNTYRIDLAYAPQGAQHSGLAAIVAGDKSPAEPATCNFVVGQPSKIDLKRRTRELKVIIGLMSPAAGTQGALTIEAYHARYPHIKACSAKTNAGGDGDGGRSCMLNKHIYVGEEYFIQACDVMQNVLQKVRVIITAPSNPPPGKVFAEPQIVNLDNETAGPAWYDERPATYEQEALEKECRKIYKALTPPYLSLRSINYSDLTDALSNKSIADLQQLKRVWKDLQLDKSDLGTFIKSKGTSTLLGDRVTVHSPWKAFKLEELHLLTHAEYDLGMVEAALNHKDGHIDMLSLMEVICTSLPSSLIGLRNIFKTQGE